MVLTINKCVLTRKQKVRMALQDVFLHAMTLTAEFALLLLGIKHLLLHWLHRKYSSGLSGFGLNSLCSKKQADYYLVTKHQQYQ